MINFRIYRLAFIPAAIALIVVLFSISGPPHGLEPLRSSGEFNTTIAVDVAEQIVALGDDRSPGSEANRQAAELMRDRLTAFGSGMVSVQDFEAEYDGRQVAMQNLILNLPGRSEDMVVVVAGRDWPAGPGAGASAAASGMLIGLAEQITNFDQDKTFVLASTDGLSEGAAGARRLAEYLAELPGQKSVIVISQPGARQPSVPFTVDSSTGRRQTSLQLERTLAGLVAGTTQTDPTVHGLWTSLSRLAVPLGLGEQGPLIADGVDAVTMSSAGEIPLRERSRQVNEEALENFGNALLQSVLAIDAVNDPLVHGPSTYLRGGETVVAGWSLVLLAVALILPALVAMLGVAGTGLRGGRSVFGVLVAAGAWAAPWLAGLVVFYLSALVGLIPRPQFPFDPYLHAIGTGGFVAIFLIGLAIAGSMFWLKPWRMAGGRDGNADARRVLAPALLLVVGALIVWVGNPFLGLLIVVLPHLWILWAARDQRSAGGDQRPLASRRIPGLLALPLAALCLLPAALAVRTVAGIIGAGPWDLLLTVSGGHFGPLLASGSALLAAGIIALCTLNPPPLPPALLGLTDRLHLRRRLHPSFGRWGLGRGRMGAGG